MPPRKDHPLALGAMCTWWDSATEVAGPASAPRCPICGKSTYRETIDEAAYFEHAEGQGKNHLALVTWVRGRCFGNWHLAQLAYEGAQNDPAQQCEECHVPLSSDGMCPTCDVEHADEPAACCGRRGFHAASCVEAEA